MFTKRYLKPGPGVPKEELPKHPVIKFLELVSRKFWSIIKLNLMYITFSFPFFVIVFLTSGLFSGTAISGLSETIAGLYGYSQNSPELQQVLISYDLGIRFILAFLFMIILGMGPISAGYSYILKCFSTETPSFIWSDFWEHTFKNIKQAVAVFIIDLAVFLLFGIAFLVYSRMSGIFHFASWFIVLFVELFMIMHFYIYTIMITFELPLKYIYKDALIFTFMKWPRNILLLIINAIVHIAIPYMIFFNSGSVTLVAIFACLEFMILPSLTGFMSVFFTYPAIDELVKNVTINE